MDGRSTQDNIKIPEGALVTIEGISGVKLIVTEQSEHREDAQGGQYFSKPADEMSKEGVVNE